MTKEIYSIRYNKLKTVNDILVSTYTVDEFYHVTGQIKPMKVIKITKSRVGKRLIISFEGGFYHDIEFTDDIELFYREVETIKRNKKNVR